jgi:uncharacterized protein (DUF2267 family)
MPYPIDQPPHYLMIRKVLKETESTRQDAARLLHVSLVTIHSWLASEDSQKHRQMPLAAWELLLLKLGHHPYKKLIDLDKNIQ